MKLNFVADKSVGRKPKADKRLASKAVSESSPDTRADLAATEESGSTQDAKVAVKTRNISLGAIKKRNVEKRDARRKPVDQEPEQELVEGEVVPLEEMFEDSPVGGLTIGYVMVLAWSLIISTAVGLFAGPRIFEFIYSLGVL